MAQIKKIASFIFLKYKAKIYDKNAPCDFGLNSLSSWKFEFEDHPYRYDHNELKDGGSRSEPSYSEIRDII